jgi:hypothetical protein
LLLISIGVSLIRKHWDKLTWVNLILHRSWMEMKYVNTYIIIRPPCILSSWSLKIFSRELFKCGTCRSSINLREWLKVTHYFVCIITQIQSLSLRRGRNLITYMNGCRSTCTHLSVLNISPLICIISIYSKEY